VQCPEEEEREEEDEKKKKKIIWHILRIYSFTVSGYGVC
jgi:hypothetical protein